MKLMAEQLRIKGCLKSFGLYGIGMFCILWATLPLQLVVLVICIGLMICIFSYSYLVARYRQLVLHWRDKMASIWPLLGMLFFLYVFVCTYACIQLGKFVYSGIVEAPLLCLGITIISMEMASLLIMPFLDIGFVSNDHE